jgi:hypothetical protein
MFVPDFEKSIPGYTGHRPCRDGDNTDHQQPKEPRKHIPGKFKPLLLILCLGYYGYVPGVKAENVYGQTYGKTSYASNAKEILKGRDLPAYKKYDTSMQSEFIDHSKRTDKILTTAEIVGVDRGESCFKKVSIPN